MITPDKAFPISYITRDDLEYLGYNASKVTDDAMEHIASKMGDDYCEQLYWTALDITAEYLGVPKRRRRKK